MGSKDSFIGLGPYLTPRAQLLFTWLANNGFLIFVCSFYELNFGLFSACIDGGQYRLNVFSTA